MSFVAHHQGVDSIIALAKSADRFDRFEALLCADSHLSNRLVFTFPLCTYQRCG